MNWKFPLRHHHGEIPEQSHPGSFAARRKFDIHTGVDLYCAHGNKVYAVEDGEVVEIEIYTGPRAESPWWNETYALLIKGESGVVCYGEIEPSEVLQKGSFVKKGQCLGSVLTVLKRYKGKPTAMLHFELYTSETTESVWWKLGDPRPANLLDPTEKLKKSLDSTVTKS